MTSKAQIFISQVEAPFLSVLDKSAKQKVYDLLINKKSGNLHTKFKSELYDTLEEANLLASPNRFNLSNVQAFTGLTENGVAESYPLQ